MGALGTARPRRPPQPATSHDVARLAAVSQSTVSRALRGEPGMSEATRERVRRAAEVLSYVPQETGRSLSTRATMRIGIVADELTNPFYPELLEPLRAELGHSGYRPLLIPDRPGSPVDIDHLADGSLDGIVLTTATLGSALPQLLADRRIPFVLVNRDTETGAGDVCVVDNHAGGTAVAALLADLGHRRVAAVLGPKDTSTARDRLAGLRDGLAERGIPLPAARVRHGPFSAGFGAEATGDLLSRPGPPSAIFCGNDVIAVGALNACARAGIRPGADLSVVGFDDIGVAAWDVCRLTTVRCDLAALTGRAVALLRQRIADPDLPLRHVVVPAELVLRQTHAPPH